MVARLPLTILAVAALAAVVPSNAQPVQPLLLTAASLTQQLTSHLSLPAAAAAAATATPPATPEAAAAAPLLDPTETVPATPAPAAPAPAAAAAAVLREPPDAGEYGVEYELSFRDAGSLLKRLSTRTKQLVEQAMTFLGTPYRRGGTSRQGVDCSGLVGVLYGQQGLEMPRTAAEQFAGGTPVALGDLQPGDLVFFRDTYKRGISHVGIFLGEGRFIHAAGHRRGTIVSELSRPYYRNRYAGARRIAPQQSLAPPALTAANQSSAGTAAAGTAAGEAEAEPVEPAASGGPKGR